MLAYASYWDASVHPDPKKTVVAGAAGPVWVWEKCEIDWRLALAKFDVPYLHMREFIYHVGPYSAACWKSEGRRAGFLAQLATIVGTATMVGIARLVSQTVFDKANEKYELDARFNPYVVCALECALRAQGHIRKLYSDDAPIHYIFEQGDIGKGKLIEEMKKRGLPEPIFRYSKPVAGKPEIKPTVQLQMCDFIAWELRKANVTQDDPEFKGYRKSLQALRAPQLPTWKEYTHLEDFCEDNNLKLRDNQNTETASSKNQNSLE
jgi:hypothetical protein